MLVMWEGREGGGVFERDPGGEGVRCRMSEKEKKREDKEKGIKRQRARQADRQTD